MNLPAEKYKLIEWLMSVEDESIVRRLQEIQKESLDSGETYQLTDTENLLIKAGLKDLEEGKTWSHDDVMREVREKYGI